MNVYEQQKQKILEKKVASVNPQAALRRGAFLPHNKPLMKSSQGPTPKAPEKQIPEWQQQVFYKQHNAHMNDDHFREGHSQLTQLAAALGQKIKNKEIPRAIAEKQFKQAVDTFAGNAREYHKNLKAQGEQDLSKYHETMDKMHSGGQVLADHIVSAQNGDKAAQKELRDIKFDWTNQQAQNVVKQYGTSPKTEDLEPKPRKMKKTKVDPTIVDDTGFNEIAENDEYSEEME